MQALVEIAGQQYDVKAKDVVKVPHLNGNQGDFVDFDKILIGKKGKETMIGTPYLNGKITVKILEHGRDKKVLVFKKKRRKGYQKLNGHRQRFTKIVVKSIDIDDLGSDEADIEEIKASSEVEPEVVEPKDEKVVFDDTAIADEEDEKEIEEEAGDQEDIVSETEEEQINEEVKKDASEEKMVFDDTVHPEEDELEEDDENKKENE